MVVELSAYEVFQIAEQIERHGRDFYEKAAQLFPQGSVAKVFTDLAYWEQRHEEVFAEMRRELGDAPSEHSADDLLPEARVMAGLAVFGIQCDPTVELSGRETVEQVLRIALQKERDSIVFYTGLKGFLKDDEAQNKVESIIVEEMRHVRIITQALVQNQQAHRETD